MKKWKLENMPAYELDKMLQSELRKDPPNGELIRRLLRILEGREKDNPVEITPEIQAAWDKFKTDDTWRADRRKPTARSWVIKVAAAAASVVILCSAFLFVIPVEANAETFWEKIMRLTDSVVEFFSSTEATEVHSEYVFQTDNPGLQEVYDSVVDLGITDPVVPMWLPDGYELKECKVTKTDSKNYLFTSFSNGTSEMVFSINLYKGNVWHEYHKDEETVDQYEFNGIVHSIIRNVDKFAAVWEKEKIECSMSIDCQEETLYRILDSIYVMEDE